jgi:soluble lytic murein transglycosylase
VEALDRGDPASAARILAPLPAQLPLIADYAAFFVAQAEAQNKRHGAVAVAVEPVWRTTQPSPLAGRAAVLAARSLLEIDDHQGAMKALSRAGAGQLPQPQADLLLARAQEGTGDPISAAARYQAIYYGFPAVTEAADARAALLRLERELGERFPPVLPRARLERARLLMEGRRAPEARAEYEAMVPLLGGLERQQARVRIGAAWYYQRKAETAIEWLSGLSVSELEADAERLYYIAASHRRAGDGTAMLAAAEELGRRVPRSEWRNRALVMAGNEFVLKNEPARFVPLYQACAGDFPDSADAPYCHWKVAWAAYLRHRPDAGALLREHLARYPASDKAGAALYFIGRLAEDAGDAAFARRLYVELSNRFTNYYYGLQAGERLRRSGFDRAGASAPADQFLASIRWPARNRQPDFTPDPLTAQRIARARLLAGAGLEKWAEIELRFAARNGGNKFPLALELGMTAAKRGAPDVALRYVKSTVPEYLWIPRDAAPRAFWKLAFPFPFRAAIESFARERSLDPFLVAALIRQESEFDPRAVSVSNAIGLMQVMPATGRELGRKAGIRGVTTAKLKNPTVNLNLGTYYLRRQLDSRNGSVEETLAGYNAGPSRIPVWKGWADYREPAEFVESIPFAQTRDYVQIILRNADVYRWLYSGEPAPPAEAKPAPAKPAPTKTQGKSRATPKK